MKKKQKQTKVIGIFILIFIILFISMYVISQAKDIDFRDDLIFFKFWNSSKENNNQTMKQYEMQIINQKPIYQPISLLRTVDSKTLVKEKIAPGTKGNFEILLTSNTDMNYKIELVNQNQKPQNFQFYFIEGNSGYIKARESKKIKVNWEWKYETSKSENKQDTKDGETLDLYNFEICVRGE